jgi:hypothetical protein
MLTESELKELADTFSKWVYLPMTREEMDWSSYSAITREYRGEFGAYCTGYLLGKEARNKLGEFGGI